MEDSKYSILISENDIKQIKYKLNVRIEKRNCAEILQTLYTLHRFLKNFL